MLNHPTGPVPVALINREPVIRTPVNGEPVIREPIHGEPVIMRSSYPPNPPVTSLGQHMVDSRKWYKTAAITIMKQHSYIAAILLASALLVSSLPASALPEIGDLAPPLKGTLFSGKRFDLAQMRGKVVLINYYSSYSKHGAIEIGNIEAFLDENRDKGLVVIFIGVDRAEDRHRVERMVKLYNLEGIMSHDLEQNGFGEKYRTPRAFVVDRQGIVRSREYGGKTPNYFHRFLTPLLAE